MSVSTKVKCSICGHEAELVFSDMGGYVEGTVFDIYQCTHCNVSFSFPTRSDPLVYDILYKHAEIVPGYERYQRYTHLARKTRRPLKALCESEPIYWAAANAIKDSFASKDISILEIGSGLGYFVYGLQQEGYQASGLDISKGAVDQAIQYFGNHYHCGDVFLFSNENAGMYDCVLMLETIEHIEDPEAFIAAGLHLLKPGGKLILTTPNKDMFSSAPWSMDPPVHLWSFSEKTFEVLSQKLGARVTFVDFTKYTQQLFAHVIHMVNPPEPKTGYRITVEGDLMPHFRVSPLKTLLLGVVGRHLVSVWLRRIKRKNVSSRLPTLCAVIHKP